MRAPLVPNKTSPTRPRLRQRRARNPGRTATDSLRAASDASPYSESSVRMSKKTFVSTAVIINISTQLNYHFVWRRAALRLEVSSPPMDGVGGRPLEQNNSVSFNLKRDLGTRLKPQRRSYGLGQGHLPLTG